MEITFSNRQCPCPLQSPEGLYRVVHVDSTTEIEVSNMVFQRRYGENKKKICHSKYLNFRCKIHLNHHVRRMYKLTHVDLEGQLVKEGGRRAKESRPQPSLLRYLPVAELLSTEIPRKAACLLA